LCAATAALAGFSSSRAEAPGGRPRLGVVIDASSREKVDAAFQRVHDLGLPTCQVHAGPDPLLSLAGPIKEAIASHKVEATAIMTLGPGRIDWDFYGGPRTCGIVPRDLRGKRMDALKKASDLARACGVQAVHTHCGFIPEDPNEALYAESVAAIKEVALHCKANGQIFLMETGQESPITLLRAIRDTGLDNVNVNLDVANLILYGKGEPVGAIDVLGPHIRGLHAKDGLYPTDPKALGREVLIGQGCVNFPEVIRRLRRLHYTGPITIERETRGAQQVADIRASKVYLEKLIAETYGAGV
jgi:L-ribulose-5-phosphate 3-epimerase